MNLNKKSITDAKLLSFLFSHPQFSLQIEAKKNEDREIEKEREENQKKKKEREMTKSSTISASLIQVTSFRIVKPNPAKQIRLPDAFSATESFIHSWRSDGYHRSFVGVFLRFSIYFKIPEFN